ncbi:MAG: 16S rRNA (cytidine(1402)-2'-O)-methyltransferase [Lactobacillales bacterium]|jgi:16S rRNA (cytidine1402-2'-O)-methyltransferase|nr:16S rRNA (cytidine(1402)-2'-O)-methyltransferase [Lactobacillales bacterium]
MNVQKSFSKTNVTGTLFLVPTPIGNLQDMTFRAVNTLKTVDLIASEDTRNTQKLLNHFEISQPQISLHEHNFKERVPQLIEKLVSGLSIAQVSDAGMPSVSDPGHELVVACIEANIPVVSLPGPTAGMTALIASGLSPQPFAFYGFLPRKKKEQADFLSEIKEQRETQIFYESPYRVADTIEVIEEVYGNRQLVLCRELTKIHEEYLRGSAQEVQGYLKEHAIKGECCLLVEGFTGEKTVEDESWRSLSIPEHVDYLMETENLRSKEAIKEVAKLREMRKQEVYRLYHVE